MVQVANSLIDPKLYTTSRLSLLLFELDTNNCQHYKHSPRRSLYTHLDHSQNGHNRIFALPVLRQNRVLVP